jgi:hypothetical protein
MAGPFGVPDLADVVPGIVWRDHEIEGPLPGASHAWVATAPGGRDKVVVEARMVAQTTAARRATWTKLVSCEHPRVARCFEAHEDAGWRYEISALPSAMVLREWIACHQSGALEIETFVRQIAPAIDALHALGVGHFNLSPDSIYILEVEGEPTFVIGGLREAVLVDQPELIPIEVDPLYAPPEAAGLSQHQPGLRLYAWDWWSLGRIVQEFLIGRHVLGLLLDRDVSRITPELRSRAEQLLLEREPAGVRAGAVEHMSAEPTTLLLLRGLLTGSCDARWSGEVVGRWLRGEQPREYYDLPRTARLWIWQQRALTIADAAELFTHAKHWEEGEQMLFEPDRTGTLAHFLRETPAYREDWERWQAVRAMTESGGWQQIDADTRRIVATALGWLALTNGTGMRGVFRVYGQTIDSPGLAALLQTPGGARGVALFNALIFPAVIEYLETLDATAGRVLKGLAAKGGTAVRVAQERGWLNPQDHAEFARLLHLSLERTVVLQDRHTQLQAAYATSRDAELARILGEKTPSPAELVISAFAGQVPDRFGLITHREWRHQRFLEAKGQADAVVTTLLWVRLRHLLEIARLWGAPWQVFVATSAAIAGVIGWLERSVTFAALIAVLLLLGRVWLVVRARHVFPVAGGGPVPWGWRDGLARAAREAQLALQAAGATPAVLAERLEGFRGQMVQYGGFHHNKPIQAHWWDTAGVFGVVTIVTLVLFAHGLARTPVVIQRTVPAAVAPSAAGPAELRVHVESQADATAPTAVVHDPQVLLATGQYEVVDDGFGRRLRGPLRRWDNFAPSQLARVTIETRARAKPEQAAFAVVNANLFLQPYVRTSVTGLLAIRVPTTRGFGIMIYNARDRQLVERDILLVQSPLPLQHRTWYELDSRHVLYLNPPLPLDPEISLAPW